jgi:hypothetical protein
MNPNVKLDETGEEEYEVSLHGKYIGAVWMNLSGTWSAIDVRDDDPTDGFDTKEDAVNWLIGW